MWKSCGLSNHIAFDSICHREEFASSGYIFNCLSMACDWYLYHTFV